MTAIIKLPVLLCVHQLVQKQTMHVRLTAAIFVTMEIHLIARMLMPNLTSKGNAAAIMEHSHVMTMFVQFLVQTHSQATVKSAYHLLLETVIMVLFVAQVMVDSASPISLAIVMVHLRIAMTHLFPFLVHPFVLKLSPMTKIRATLIVDFNAIMEMHLLVRTMWMSLDLRRLILKSSVHATTAYFLAIAMLVLNRVLMLNQFLDHHAHLLYLTVVDTMSIVAMALRVKAVLQ
jgi:hypothetical protein